MGPGSFPKTINDPIWGVIELFPWESLIVDSLLLQRLRGVRQLGMAHYVYPGAGHSRLEHTLGVVEAADRMIRSLERNADHHRRFGKDLDPYVPDPDEIDKCSIRLAALLHDAGHGPFSHVSETLLRDRLASEFDQAEEVLRDRFEGVANIAASEVVAVLMVLSHGMCAILEHPRLGAAVSSPADLPVAIAARILGSRSFLKAGYLSGVISGPLDADKLDYMARDSHHAGLPTGLDLNRLISKLEVVVVTAENAPNDDLRKRARASSSGRFYEMGISLAGLGAYEQMIIGRVILYDRLYYHHKVRAAESMVRRLITAAEEERGTVLACEEFFHPISDDALLSVFSGQLASSLIPSGQERASAIGQALRERRLYYRAFAFAARFIAGLEGLPEEEQHDTRSELFMKVLLALRSTKACDDLAREIYRVGAMIAECVPELAAMAKGFSVDAVLVDLPLNKVVVQGGDILTRTERGDVGTPTLFFDPDRWSRAYEHQKQCGFVFAPREFIPLVAIASRVVFFEKFALTMTAAADRASKTVDIVKSKWIDTIAARGVISSECHEALTVKKPRFLPIRESELRLPDDWRRNDPSLARRLSDGLQDALPGGLPASVHASVIDAIEHLVTFIEMAEKGGAFAGVSELSEKRLQERLRDHLRSREVQVQEGPEVGGGETDLVLPGSLVVENKVRGRTANPFEAGPHYAWQVRRYAIAVSSKVTFIVLAYQPADETSILPLTQRIAATRPEGAPDGFAQVRVVIPWGQSVPSHARAPETKRADSN
jgi:HD superfamily phosphohydrolase